MGLGILAAIVAGVLAAYELLETRGRSVLAWSVLILAVALAAGYL